MLKILNGIEVGIQSLLGEGRLDLKGLAAVLKKSGFNGYATIEYEGDEDNPVPGIKKCIEVLIREFSV